MDHTRERWLRSSIVALSVTTMVIVGSCGSSGSSIPATEARALAFDHLAERSQTGDRIVTYESLAELLPNVGFRVDDAPPHMFTTAVVVGEVASVEPGLAWVVEGEDAPGGTETDFDDRLLRWGGKR
jgi:hypothetical protein